MKKTLIIGAGSAIAQATARQMASDGNAFFLVGRDKQRMFSVAQDLEVRGASSADVAEMDVLEYGRHRAVVQQGIETLGGIDVVIIAHGTLPDQQRCERDFELTRQAIEVNALSVMSILTIVADYFEKRDGGTIVVISSVAGDRGRQSNYIYGSAKAAVTVFAQGLRNRLASRHVNVITVKPGFVISPMTEQFKKGFLWSDPEVVARKINRAISKRSESVYAPGFWRFIMIAIKAIPEKLFKHLKL